MIRQVKSILRIILPKRLREFFWRLIPKFNILNTYKLAGPKAIKNLSVIDSKFIIRKVSWGDSEMLKKAHIERGKNAFKSKVVSRLNSDAWVGLAVIDQNENAIAYIAWIVIKNTNYISDFEFQLEKGEFLLKDGYCVKAYRHQGLHTRMEQERINYCVRNSAKQIYIQILNSNKKGINSVLGNGYDLFRKDRLIYWPVFKLFRPIKGFLKRPFLKIIK